jgi:tRNA (guanine37-N1)-methyltransferase
MWLGVVTLFPAMFRPFLESGVVGRALARGLADVQLWNPRDFARDRHHRVDDRPYGGGPGMVMQVQPLRDAIRAARAAAGDGASVLLLSPQGGRLDQRGVNELHARGRLVLVAARYEGVDERLVQLEVDQEWSIGDYVLSGGELAAMVLIDAITRLIPGALGHRSSAQQDSFMQGLLDHPHYTRPEVVEGLRVPEVLLSGDHQAICRWRHKQALGRTWQRRPDLLESMTVDAEQRRMLEEFIAELRDAQRDRV